MEDGKLEELAEKMLAQPKEVEVDGQRVENQSVGDLLKVASYFAAKRATSGRRCPLRITKMAAGGAIL
ncbi:MAG: hypothetical protein ACI4QF_06750 [Kiritimatiellia bacterium]